jgi:hypothetical protein
MGVEVFRLSMYKTLHKMTIKLYRSNSHKPVPPFSRQMALHLGNKNWGFLRQAGSMKQEDSTFKKKPHY